jgi:hypothetical protein
MFDNMSRHLGKGRKIQNNGKFPLWKCHYCNKNGHIKPYCNQLYGFPKGLNYPRSNHVTRKVWIAKNTKTAHIAHTSFRASSREDWYFNSGCSRHMIGVKNYLEDIQSYSTSFVTFGDGAKGEILGIGKLAGTDLPKLDDVLLVKGLTANLISISQLCDQGLKVNLTKLKCLVKNEQNEVIMKGTRSKDNCYLWLPKEIEKSSTCLMSKYEEVKLWHQKLGHLNLRGMKRIMTEEAIRGLPKLRIEEGKICGECQI